MFRLSVGTKSLLFGVHQFLWHPWTVYRAWVALYGRPTWREAVCIFVHDWGYWGCPNMDGPEGTRHPELGARIASKLFGPEFGQLTLLHSRHYAKQKGLAPGRLCWADKLSHCYEPAWWYLLRAKMSGELQEYRANADRAGMVPLAVSDEVWFAWIQQKFRELAQTMNPASVPYMMSARQDRAAK